MALELRYGEHQATVSCLGGLKPRLPRLPRFQMQILTVPWCYFEGLFGFQEMIFSLSARQDLCLVGPRGEGKTFLARSARFRHLFCRVRVDFGC